MRKLKKTAALFCAAALTLLPAVPAFADFDQSVLDGVVLLYSGAPDEDGAMEYWRGTGFFVQNTIISSTSGDRQIRLT